MAAHLDCAAEELIEADRASYTLYSIKCLLSSGVTYICYTVLNSSVVASWTT